MIEEERCLLLTLENFEFKATFVELLVIIEAVLEHCMDNGKRLFLQTKRTER